MPMPNPLPPPSWREPPPPPPNEKPPLRPPPPECPPEKPPEERPPPEKPPDERPPPEKPPPLLPPPDLPMALLHARKPAKPAPRTRKACELKGSQEHMLARRRSNSPCPYCISSDRPPSQPQKGKHNFEALTTLGVLPAIIRNRRAGLRRLPQKRRPRGRRPFPLLHYRAVFQGGVAGHVDVGGAARQFGADEAGVRGLAQEVRRVAPSMPRPGR